MPLTVPAVERIRVLNDNLRQMGIGGKIIISRSIAELDAMTQYCIMQAIRRFSDFTPDNDPYGEHDCAIVTFEEYRVMFKIDYYDPSMTYGSEDPADPNKTARVMTIMFPEDY